MISIFPPTTIKTPPLNSLDMHSFVVFMSLNGSSPLSLGISENFFSTSSTNLLPTTFAPNIATISLSIGTFVTNNIFCDVSTMLFFLLFFDLTNASSTIIPDSLRFTAISTPPFGSSPLNFLFFISSLSVISLTSTYPYHLPLTLCGK